MAEERIHPSRRVLIVEDERKLREMLTRAVRDMEFEVRAVATAEDAMTQLAETPADIILSDLNLPGVPGMELCELTRRRWPETQIVILTGYGDLEAAQHAIRLDVVDFLTKPCTLQDLEAALDRALRRRRYHIIARPVDGGGHEEPEQTPEPDDDDAPARRLVDVERECILAALARHDGNREETAKELGISVRTLYYRLDAYEKQGHIRR